MFLFFVTLPLTRREQDDREYDERHNSQDHHHGDADALPVPRGTIWTSQVLLWQEHTHTNTMMNVSTAEEEEEDISAASFPEFSPWRAY